MALPLKRIKEKSVIVDEGIGEAIVKIVLHGKHRDEIKTIITRMDAISLLEKEGIEILGRLTLWSLEGFNFLLFDFT